jgi:hypothetical protein
VALPDTLVSDGERERAVERLREAAGEGRLTTDEFSERLDRAYAVRTRGELDGVLDGLPKPALPRRRRTWRRLQHMALWFVPVNVICIAVWAITGAEAHFWPKWVLLGTGIRLLIGVRGLAFAPPGSRRLPPPPAELDPPR